MKRFVGFVSVFLVVMVSIYVGFSQNRMHQLVIGGKIPQGDFVFVDAHRKYADLTTFKKTHGTLVIFSCNQCPFVQGWEDRYGSIDSLCETLEVGFVLINSNARRRDSGDSLADMIAHASQMGYASIPYLLDEQSRFANEIGAQTTPHVFLFDKGDRLVYKGAIDDNYKHKEKVQEFYLTDALRNMVDGILIQPNATPPKGCSIKRIVVK